MPTIRSAFILSCTLAASATIAAARTDPPASQPVLSGPKAVEDDEGRLTLVSRTFDGQVESVGPQPDAVAIAMLELTVEQKAQFAEIDSARKSAFDQIVRNNYGLMLELASFQSETSPARVEMLRKVADAFKPYTDRGSFYQEMWPHLDDQQRAQIEAMVREYRDARLEAMRREMAGSAPAAIAARERLEAFGQMIQESIERQVGLERQQFEELANELALTPEQRNAAEAIFQPLAIKRFQNLEVTREEQSAAFAEFNKLLTAGQKQKVLGILLRQFQRPTQDSPPPPLPSTQPDSADDPS